jgi:superfamily II DNA/RNA helicase
VTHTVIKVDQDQKRDLLLHLFAAHGWHQVLVFCRTKHGSDALARKLEQAGVRTAALHGNKSQNARTRALADFKAGKLAALVATDIAARGLDIDSLPRVVNFELPNVPEDYIHRIGRTGRAGASGEALEPGQQRRAHPVARHRAPAEARDPDLGPARLRAAAQPLGAAPPPAARRRTSRPRRARAVAAGLVSRVTAPGVPAAGAERPSRPAITADSGIADYQMRTRWSGARHIGSPGWVPMALWKASRWSSGATARTEEMAW